MRCRIVLAVIMLLACDGLQEEQTRSRNVGGIEEVDDLDVRVWLLDPPQRIVSLAPSNTELLYALGLGNRVVGVTEHCNYPPAAKSVEKIGAFKAISIEKILALRPELVLAIKGNALESLDALRGFDVPVFAFNIGSVGELLEGVSRLGRLAGVERTADSLRVQLDARLRDVTQKVGQWPGRPRMMWGHWGEPIFTAGAGTYIDDVLRLAGGENLGRRAAGAWPQISLETVMAWAPEILISTMEFAPERREREIEALRRRDGWKSIPAVKGDGIVFLPADLLLRPGPRVLEALEQLVFEVNRRASEL